MKIYYLHAIINWQGIQPSGCNLVLIRKPPALWQAGGSLNPLMFFCFLFLYCLERLIKIFDYIINMLCTDWKSYCTLWYTLICKLLIIKLWMSCWSRMYNKALNICNICKDWEDLEAVDELVCCFLATLNLECEDTSTAIMEILLVKLMIRMILKWWMINLLYKWVALKVLDNLLCVLCVSVKSQRQSLNSLK